MFLHLASMQDQVLAMAESVSRASCYAIFALLSVDYRYMYVHLDLIIHVSVSLVWWLLLMLLCCNHVVLVWLRFLAV